MGDSGRDNGFSIAVNGSGNVYVGGSSDATWGSPKRVYTGSWDAWVAWLNNSGALIQNTFLGGGGDDWGNAIAVDSNGNAYVAGRSNATWGSPVRPYTGSWDAFAAKLDNSGAVIWNTFPGGGGEDRGNAIAVDGNGNAYVAGSSNTT